MTFIRFIFNRQLNGNGKDPAYMSLEQNILMKLAGSDRLFAIPVTNWWSQIKSAGSAIYANRHYLALYHRNQPARLSAAVRGKCHIIGDVHIHDSAAVHPTAVV